MPGQRPDGERIPLPVAATGRLKILGSIGASTLSQHCGMKNAQCSQNKRQCTQD